MEFNIRDRPRPRGNTTPSQNWNLYESVAAPRRALESMACEVKAATTIWICLSEAVAGERERTSDDNRTNKAKMITKTTHADVYQRTHRGKERPATKKFSLSPLTKTEVAKPMITKSTIEVMTAMPNPYTTTTFRIPSRWNIKRYLCNVWYEKFDEQFEKENSASTDKE